MRILVCIPAHGDTRAAFTLSLAKMLLRTVADWPGRFPGETLVLDTILGSGGVVALVREGLVEAAERWGADAILWLDSDQTFPPDSLLRLVASGEAVIGANIPRRAPDARPTAELLDGDGRRIPLYTTPDKAEAGEIEPVHLMGLGVCLTRMAALKALPRPIFDQLREDHGLMRKLAQAGFQPKVDHALSAEVGHVGTFTWTNQHSLAARAARTHTVTLTAAPGAGVVQGKMGE